VQPENVDFVLECLTAEAGYSVGDRLHLGNIWGFAPTNNQLSPSLATTRNGWSFIQPSTYEVANKSTGGDVGITAADWKYKITARRGW
jgi:hypothetical protein